MALTQSGAGLSRDDAAVINLQRFAFDIGAIESFRYRVEDVLRGITPAAIRSPCSLLAVVFFFCPCW